MFSLRFAMTSPQLRISRAAGAVLHRLIFRTYVLDTTEGQWVAPHGLCLSRKEFSHVVLCAFQHCHVVSTRDR